MSPLNDRDRIYLNVSQMPYGLARAIQATAEWPRLQQALSRQGVTPDPGPLSDTANFNHANGGGNYGTATTPTCPIWQV